MEDVETQQTQPSTDPRRLGRNNSGLTNTDISDVLCILHPASPAAYKVVSQTAQLAPQHILRNTVDDGTDDEDDVQDLEEQETFRLDSRAAEGDQDLALRMSSKTVQPLLGFCFGRNNRTCDIVLDTDSHKRISNLHFRIYINESAVLMLEDMSTNGTLVDTKHLKGKNPRSVSTRMLLAGSIIQVPSADPTETIKFIVRIPSRTGYQEDYLKKLLIYTQRLTELEQKHPGLGDKQRRDTTQLAKTLHVPANPFGMHWDGGDEYNVVDLLGKGAFATVYKIATKKDGECYAAKELEKRRFIKNGRLDQRLDNEMRIMQSIRHDNIVQYMKYEDRAEHLYIIMEYVPYGDLQGYLSSHKTLAEKDAKVMSRQVLDALLYLHDKQITHRDIKPDNILISSYDPFTTKLSDFGLSKVVNTNETFLKTFCGTLLYCAPEVFPHYEEHASQKGIKRRRSGPSAGKYHSYSQSVDIWSYAAVLWLSMCGSPPFEGVVDQTGKGMFNKIMGTKLDYSPLLAHAVSTQAIDLLLKMLNTDPSRRPNEIECLQHPWLYDGRQIVSASQFRRGLKAIAEEDEGGHGIDGQTHKFSQLSVIDPSESDPTDAGAARALPHVEELEEGPSFNSGDFDEWLDPRESKRVKPDTLIPRDQIRDQEAIPSSSPEPSDDEEDALPTSGGVNPRLFGEISDSALQSSNVLDERMYAALELPETENGHPSNMSLDGADEGYQARQTSDLYRSDAAAAIAYPSLLDNESVMHDLQIEPTSQPATSGGGSDSVDEPETPKTPHEDPSESKSPVSERPRPSQEATPRQNGGKLKAPSLSGTAVPESQESLVATLRTTSDSVHKIELKLYNQMSSWGRDPACTFQHWDTMDTRIPKRAFIIWFHAYGIEREEREGRDWRLMPDLHTVISTDSSIGVLINGVRLHKLDVDGERLCGRLYTGDIITIFDTRNRVTGSQAALRFVCDFYTGEAERRRPEDLPFVPIRAIEPSQPRQSF